MATAPVPRLLKLDDTEAPRVEVGAGEPVVFLHGALGDWRTWKPLLGLIGEQRRAIAYTQRWFGADQRDHGAKPFGTATHAADLIALLDELGLASAHVVAWSYAAHAALAAACAHSDRFRSLVLYDLGFPTFVADADAMATIAAEGAKSFGPVAAAAGRGDWAKAAALLIDAAAAEEGYFDRQPEVVRRIHLDNAHTVALLFTQTAPVPLLPEDLNQLSVPTAVAWGAESPAAYRLTSQAAGRLIPDCFAQEIDGAGHLWPEQDPAGFAAHVLAAQAQLSR